MKIDEKIFLTRAPWVDKEEGWCKYFSAKLRKRRTELEAARTEEGI